MRDKTLNFAREVPVTASYDVAVVGADHVLFSRISMQALTGGELDGTQRTVWLKL